MYNGAPNRYTWELKGKQELYIPYNDYRLHSNDLKYDQILQPDILIHNIFVMKSIVYGLLRLNLNQILDILIKNVFFILMKIVGRLL